MSRLRIELDGKVDLLPVREPTLRTLELLGACATLHVKGGKLYVKIAGPASKELPVSRRLVVEVLP